MCFRFHIGLENGACFNIYSSSMGGSYSETEWNVYLESNVRETKKMKKPL